MNLNGDEKRIQRLFREISLEDSRQTPQFVRVLEGASSRAGRDRIRSLRFAVVVATLIVVALLAVWALRQRQEGAGQNPIERAEGVPAPMPQPAPKVDPRKTNVPRPSVEPRVVKRIRHRRPANEPVIDTKSLFAWQSPTASLLNSTTQDLLMSLPHLGESLETIKSFSPDLWN